MAFVPKDPNLEDEQGQGQAEPGVPPPAGESSALGTGAAPGGAAGGKATPQNRTASSSGFTNLNKYVSANQPQAAELGGQIRSKIGESINQASTQAAEVDKGYAEKVNPNQYAFDAKKFDPLKQDKAQFQNLFAAPKSTFGTAGEVDNATKAIDTAKTKAGQVDTIGGRKELISDQQSLSKAAGVNTAGMRSFDNLLLQSSKQGQDALLGAKGDLAAAGLDEKLKAAQARAQAVDAQAKQAQLSGSQAAKAALTSSNQALTSDLDKRLASAKGSAISQNQALVNKVKNFSNLTPAELKNLGVSAEDWSRAQALAKSNPQAAAFKGSEGTAALGQWNAAPYLKNTGSIDSMTRENVATADDIARAKALAELGGFAGMSLGGMPSQAAQFNTDVTDLDISRLLADLTPAEVEQVIAAAPSSGNKPVFVGTDSSGGPRQQVGEKIVEGVKSGAKEVKSWF
jgi:hypothetical protein